MEKRVEKLDDFGRGITRIDNKVCFVKNALKDEVVEVEITSNKKKYMVGRSSKIITKSNEEYILYTKGSFDSLINNCSYIYEDNKLIKETPLTIKEKLKKASFLTLYKRYLSNLITGNINY